MSTGLPTENATSETCICEHSGPPTCERCGGINGVPGIPPCLRCKLRGGPPAVGESVVPPDPSVQRIIDNSGLYDDTV